MTVNMKRTGVQPDEDDMLRTRFEQYRLLFDNAVDVIYSVDAQFRILYVSPSIEKHLGYRPEELCGKPFTGLGLLTKDSLSRAIADTMRIINGEVLDAAEYELIAKDGTRRLAEIRSTPVYKDGKVRSIVSVARDITAQRKVEQALAASEGRFRTMAENITCGLIIMEEGRMVYANDRACQLCGYPRDDLIALWGPELTAPRSSEEKDQILREIRETGVYPEQVDTWIICKDGTQCCLNLRFSFAYSSDKKQTGYVIITDRTQQRLAEEEIRKTSDFLDNVIENSLDPIVIGDSLGNITRINKAFIKLVGFNQEELTGKHLAELVPPHAGSYESTDGTVVMVDESFYDRAYKQMGTLIERGHLSSRESFYFKKDGTVVPVEQTMFYLYDKKGSRIGVVTINRDISERKKAEQKLIETRNFLSDIIRTSADGIVVTDTLGTITLVNDAVERILGYSREEIMGKNIHDFMIPPDESLRGAYAEAPSNGTDSVFFFESKWRAHGGGGIDLAMSVSALKDAKDNTTGMVSCIRDITDHKAAERKLYEYQNQLRCLASQLTLTEEQERKHIASEIHDRIAQSLALAKIKLGALGAAVKTGDKENDVAAIRSLLEQSIRDTRSLIFDLSPPFLYEFGLEKALEWLLEDMERQHGIKTHLTYHGNQGSYDDDVRILLYQSIRELLINIVKHAQAKTATVSLDRNTQKVHVSVEDDGQGFLMSPDGFQMNKSGGYGIFSIKERFHYLGGELRVESRLRYGTRIDLELPLVQ